MIASDLSAACLAEHSTRAPRYTSYPAATELGPISPAAVIHELEAVRADGPASLYVHVPFCRSLCWYCGCNVIATRDASRGDDYITRLIAEMAVVSGVLGPRFPVAELALGGGSPNFLSVDGLRTMVTAIERCFAVADDARRSIELDPRRTTSQQIEALVDLGFTSMSVGVQDFAGPVQDAIHRHQSRVQTAWLIDYARHRGFRDVNVDIVYGLPLQTEQSFATTLDAILQLAPDRIALFGYAHLPSKLPHQQLVERAGRVLDPRERAALLLLGIERLTAAGYLHLGLDHFARPGSALARAAAEHRMVRTFQGYVEHRADTVLGLGVSAISSTRRMFWQNHGELTAWQSAVAEHRLPIARGRVLDRDDQIRRVVIGKLMCEGAVELAAIEHDLDIVAAQYFADELAELAAMPELAAYDAGANAVSTTPLGRLLVRNVCQVFDRYRHAGDAPRYSSTI